MFYKNYAPLGQILKDLSKNPKGIIIFYTLLSCFFYDFFTHNDLSEQFMMPSKTAWSWIEGHQKDLLATGSKQISR